MQKISLFFLLFKDIITKSNWFYFANSKKSTCVNIDVKDGIFVMAKRLFIFTHFFIFLSASVPKQSKSIKGAGLLVIVYVFIFVFQLLYVIVVPTELLKIPLFWKSSLVIKHFWHINDRNYSEEINVFSSSIDSANILIYVNIYFTAFLNI